MYYNVPTVIANAGFTENISNIIPTFEEPIVIATWALVIITAIYATINLYMLLIMKRDRERRVIVEIVKNFLIPTIDTLKEDRKQFKKINISSFPEFLGLQFGISDRFLKSAIFDSFAKRKPLLKRRILKYNELCSKIHEKIKELKGVAREEGITYPIVNKEGDSVRIAERYENEEIIKILEEKGLNKNIEDIEDISGRLRLDKKAEKSIRKLERIKRKLQDKYNLTDEELRR